MISYFLLLGAVEESIWVRSQTGRLGRTRGSLSSANYPITTKHDRHAKGGGKGGDYDLTQG